MSRSSISLCESAEMCRVSLSESRSVSFSRRNCVYSREGDGLVFTGVIVVSKSLGENIIGF